WRADRPQKGRYREFYQCDADIAGTTSIISDIELAGIYFKVFKELKIPVVIKMNNRKILAGLAEICDVGNLSTISTAIDKIDKIGMHEVEKELYANGLVNAQVATIRQYLSIAGNNREKLDAAAPLFEGNKMGKSGIDEMNAFLAISDHDAYAKEFLQIDFTLARGLNYYTGVIYEVQATDVQIGSIGGGGRYDDLTGLFGLPNVPGVGISFGVDRIYDVMEELNLFPENIMKSTTVLFLNLGNDESKFSFYAMQNLRNIGVSCELFYDNAKLEKQFKYASRKNIRFAVIIGSREAEEKNCQIKDLHTGQQSTIPISELNTYFAKK
ncbi:MAG: HisS family protein, partial [Ginsengibacter sp.]